MAKDTQLESFVDSLQSVATLVGDLATNIADAQSRMDADYMKSLVDFGLALKQSVGTDSLNAEQFVGLFRSLAPARYQFTETVIDVRADLQMSSFKEIAVQAGVQYKTPVLAVAVNASYVKRSAYDSSAAARIRTTLHAVPPDQAVMKALLERTAKAPAAEKPKSARFKEIGEALKNALPAPPAP